MNAKDAILSGKTALGIEFGSTRIKAVLVGEDNQPIAAGTTAGKTDWKTAFGHILLRIYGQDFRTHIRIWRRMQNQNMAWILRQ